MAKTPSNMLDLGTTAPDFRLPSPASDQVLSLSDLAGEHGTLVMFICNHCPYVVHVAHGLKALADDYLDKKIGFVAINSNDVEHYPDDAPDKMVTFAKKNGFTFPYLFDESQSVAKAYKAACTPDFYLFNSDRKLVYRGQLDGSRPGNDVPVTGEDLRRAMTSLLNHEPIDSNQKPSIGCNIKWKPS